MMNRRSHSDCEHLDPIALVRPDFGTLATRLSVCRHCGAVLFSADGRTASRSDTSPAERERLVQISPQPVRFADE